MCFSQQSVVCVWFEQVNAPLDSFAKSMASSDCTLETLRHFSSRWRPRQPMTVKSVQEAESRDKELLNEK